MGYSQVQRQGFILAFEEKFPNSNIAPHTLLKGCYYHWKQSVQQFVSNHAIVPAGRDVDFIDYTNQMYHASGEKSYSWAVQQVCNGYPNAKKWLDWWTRDEVAGMIFKSKAWLKQELQDHPYRTSNGVEARYRDLYRIVEKKKPLMQTLHQIFCHLQSSELDLEFVDAGGRVDYNRKKTRYITIKQV